MKLNVAFVAVTFAGAALIQAAPIAPTQKDRVVITGTELRQARDATAGNEPDSMLSQSSDSTLTVRDPSLITDMITKYKGYKQLEQVSDSEAGPRVVYFDPEWANLGLERLHEIYKGLHQRATWAQQSALLAKDLVKQQGWRVGSKTKRYKTMYKDRYQTFSDWLYAMKRAQAAIDEKTPKRKLPHLTRGPPSAL